MRAPPPHTLPIMCVDVAAADWRSVLVPPPLAANEAHVWRIELNVAEPQLEELAVSLSAAERERADRFRFSHDRARFIAAHSALRTILARYLEIRPGDIVFEHTRFGKPFITQPETAGAPPLSFNLSHSHEVALVAVCRGHAIGVDVERIRPELAEQGIAERFFAPAEVAALRGLPPEAWPEAFFRCWTRKEAFVKARGEGLSLPLHRFTVSLAPDQPAALLSVADDPAEADRWHLYSLIPWPGYVGALAVACRACRVMAFHFSAGLA